MLHEATEMLLGGPFGLGDYGLSLIKLYWPMNVCKDDDGKIWFNDIKYEDSTHRSHIISWGVISTLGPVFVTFCQFQVTCNLLAMVPQLLALILACLHLGRCEVGLLQTAAVIV